MTLFKFWDKYGREYCQTVSGNYRKYTEQWLTTGVLCKTGGGWRLVVGCCHGGCATTGGGWVVSCWLPTTWGAFSCTSICWLETSCWPGIGWVICWLATGCVSWVWMSCWVAANWTRAACWCCCCCCCCCSCCSCSFFFCTFITENINQPHHTKSA